MHLALTGEKADAVLVSPLAVVGAGEPGGPTDAARDRGSEPHGGGRSNKAIARRLDISVHTVKFHVGSLLDKLDAAGRTDAVAQAARLGVINL